MNVTRFALTILSICILCANGGLAVEIEKYLSFPPNFLLGAATAAFQVEGAWNVSGKGESVWDHFVHGEPGRIFNRDNADDACKSYYKYKEDVALLKEVGFKAYRFSISWPRLLPEGFIHKINVEAIRYYKELINELLANDIQPVVTLYHWDHPQVIEDAGGWTNPNIVNWFEEYSRLVFKEFGGHVKYFITVNEPCFYCLNAYALGHHAPGKITLRGNGEYLCLENQMKAHARAYRIYEKEFKATQNGSIGINIHMQTFYPKDANESWAADVAFQFTTGWILHPIYSETGDYPEIMKQMVAEKSREQGYSKSRLPELSAEWIDYIRGSSDFLAVNQYTSHLVERRPGGSSPSFFNDLDIKLTYDPSWESSNSAWLKVVPAGMGDALRNLSIAYGNPPMYISENGVSTDGVIEDTKRIKFYSDYVKEMLIAVNRDGVNVKGYLLWSLIDNFEWERGYSERFGIVHVNFTHPERPRTLKASAYWWKNVLKTGRLPTTNFDIDRRPTPP